MQARREVKFNYAAQASTGHAGQETMRNDLTGCFKNCRILYLLNFEVYF